MEILQSKLSVYEENPAFQKFGGRNDLNEFDMIGVDELQEKISDLEHQVDDLTNQNKVLRISNQSELNTKVLQMEQEVTDYLQ